MFYALVVLVISVPGLDPGPGQQPAPILNTSLQFASADDCAAAKLDMQRFLSVTGTRSVMACIHLRKDPAPVLGSGH
jgi:hypothetical protein